MKWRRKQHGKQSLLALSLSLESRSLKDPQESHSLTDLGWPFNFPFAFTYEVL